MVELPAKQVIQTTDEDRRVRKMQLCETGADRQVSVAVTIDVQDMKGKKQEHQAAV